MAITRGGMFRLLSVATIPCHSAELKAFSMSTVVGGHKSFRPQDSLFAILANFMTSLVAWIVDLPSLKPNYQSRCSSSASSFPRHLLSRQIGLSFFLSPALPLGISVCFILKRPCIKFHPMRILLLSRSLSASASGRCRAAIPLVASSGC
jgi:hypothetical protein